jgi:hypothetical protein
MVGHFFSKGAYNGKDLVTVIAGTREIPLILCGARPIRKIMERPGERNWPRYFHSSANYQVVYYAIHHKKIRAMHAATLLGAKTRISLS